MKKEVLGYMYSKTSFFRTGIIRTPPIVSLSKKCLFHNQTKINQYKLMWFTPYNSNR